MRANSAQWLVDVGLGCPAQLAPLASMVLHRRTYEAREQRVRQVRLALEFRMELAADEMGVPRELHHFDLTLVGRDPAQIQPALL
jgi:hypothetical protein